MKPSHYMPKSLKFIYMTYIENAKELLLLDLRNERRLLRFYSPENRKPLKRSGSIKPRKFRTFALIPPPKNYYRSFRPIVKPNNTTLAPPTRFPQSGIPPHVQIRNKLDPLPDSNLIKKKRPNTLSISKENINLVRSLPSFNEND